MMPSMRRQEFTSTADDGVRLFHRSWLLAPKAAVIIVHGYAEHSGRYEHVAKHLAEKGYAGARRTAGPPTQSHRKSLLFAPLSAK